jgi:DNA-directed RNA polymerase specialized sigma24 family protein
MPQRQPVEPLKAHTEDGRRYERLPAVTRQIEDASALPMSALLNQARSGAFRAETLVYFIKKHHIDNDPVVYYELYRLLIFRHASPRLSKAFRGFDEHTQKDLQQQASLMIVEDIAAEDESGDWAQILFQHYLTSIILTLRRSARRERARANKFNPAYEALVIEDDRGADAANREKRRFVVGRALMRVPKLLRQIVYERHVKGERVGSDDKSDTRNSIARKYGTSGRTARTRIREGERRLGEEILRLLKGGL